MTDTITRSKYGTNMADLIQVATYYGRAIYVNSQSGNFEIEDIDRQFFSRASAMEKIEKLEKAKAYRKARKRKNMRIPIVIFDDNKGPVSITVDKVTSAKAGSWRSRPTLHDKERKEEYTMDYKAPLSIGLSGDLTDKQTAALVQWKHVVEAARDLRNAKDSYKTLLESEDVPAWASMTGSGVDFSVQIEEEIIKWKDWVIEQADASEDQK